MAVRPIDANALLAEISKWPESVMYKDWVQSAIAHAPTLTPPNDPLTLGELKQMDGEPVYLIVDDGYEPLEMWALIDVPEKDHIVLINNIGGRSAYYSDDDLERDHITVYRRPPEGEEGT